MAKFELGLCHHCPFSLMAPTVAKNGVTVTMKSGKPFNHQLALALQADASLTDLLLTHQCILVVDAAPISMPLTVSLFLSTSNCLATQEEKDNMAGKLWSVRCLG